MGIVEIKQVGLHYLVLLGNRFDLGHVPGTDRSLRATETTSPLRSAAKSMRNQAGRYPPFTEAMTSAPKGAISALASGSASNRDPRSQPLQNGFFRGAR